MMQCKRTMLAFHWKLVSRYMASRQRSLLLILLLTASALSQAPTPLPTHAITGTVHDPSNAAIVGASVSVIDTDDNEIAQTITDNSGVFRFDRLSPTPAGPSLSPL